jgi:hypothetical protein
MVPSRLAKEQQIVLRTARRWVERYRKSGLAGLVRKERNDRTNCVRCAVLESRLMTMFESRQLALVGSDGNSLPTSLQTITNWFGGWAQPTSEQILDVQDFLKKQKRHR